MSKRLKYAIATAVIFAVEVLIALFVHDNFIRPYIGDVLVTVLICCFLKMLFLDKIPFVPLWVFLFAAGVEVMQYFDIVELLGLQNSRFFSVLIGSVFDMKDIICYAAGSALFGLFGFVKNKFRQSKI